MVGFLSGPLKKERRRVGLKWKSEWKTITLCSVLAIYLGTFFYLQYHTLFTYGQSNVIVDRDGNVYTANAAKYRGKRTELILYKYDEKGRNIWTRTSMINEDFSFINQVYFQGDRVALLTGNHQYRLSDYKLNGKLIDTISLHLADQRYGYPDGLVQGTGGGWRLVVMTREDGKSHRDGERLIIDPVTYHQSARLQSPFPNGRNYLTFIGIDRGRNLIYSDGGNNLVLFSPVDRVLATGMASEYISAFAEDNQGDFYFAGQVEGNKDLVYVEKRKGLNRKVWRYEWAEYAGRDKSQNLKDKEVFVKVEQLAADGSGCIYLAVTVSDYTQFRSRSDTYLIKVNERGEKEWQRIISNTLTFGKEVNGMAIGGNGIYLTGKEDKEVFLAKYDLRGRKLWYNDELWRDLPIRKWFDF